MKRLGELSPAATHALVFFFFSDLNLLGPHLQIHPLISWTSDDTFVLSLALRPWTRPFDLPRDKICRLWPVSLEDAESRGCEYDILANVRDHHIIHCALLWKLQLRASAENWRFIDPVIASEEHTFHCADFLVNVTMSRNPQIG